MRICLYTATALPKLGGQEAVVDALARHFTLLGHRAVVLAPQPRLPLWPRDGELPYPVFRHPRFYSTRRFVSWYRRWLVKLHRREHFDVVHCHDVYPTGWVASLCRRQVRIPLVITSHGGDVKEGNIRVSKPGMRPRYVQAVGAADALVSIGRFTEEGFRQLSPKPARLEFIPNGIDLAPFEQPATRPASLDPAIQPGQYVLFLGRLKHRKGVDVLLKAAADGLPPRAGQIVIAGTGDEEDALHALARELGLTDRVKFVGRVDGASKIYLLQNALCVVMPSRVWEAFPLVMLESYAAGQPVVGTRIPGISELVQEGITGLLVGEDSPQDLALALRTLIEDPGRARAMGQHAKQAAQGYAWEAVARKHLALYEELISERR